MGLVFLPSSVDPSFGAMRPLRRLQTELQTEKEAHIATQQRLSAATADLSQSTMLDLELADYQRTVDNLNW
jgi:hypothetical protein